MRFFIFAILTFLAVSQECMDNSGKRVDWWAILKVPPKIGSSGYGYIDSVSQTSDFKYINTHVDQGNTALTFTLSQINSMKLETSAWNDEKPTGQTSTTKAHSKGLIGFSFDKKRGFFLSHSLPKYPAFSGSQVILTIAPAENYYGQDLFCVSMSINELDKLASRLMTTHLYVYYSNIIDGSATHNLYQLGKGQ